MDNKGELLFESWKEQYKLSLAGFYIIICLMIIGIIWAIISDPYLMRFFCLTSMCIPAVIVLSYFILMPVNQIKFWSNGIELLTHLKHIFILNKDVRTLHPAYELKAPSSHTQVLFEKRNVIHVLTKNGKEYKMLMPENETKKTYFAFLKNYPSRMTKEGEIIKDSFDPMDVIKRTRRRVTMYVLGILIIPFVLIPLLSKSMIEHGGMTIIQLCSILLFIVGFIYLMSFLLLTFGMIQNLDTENENILVWANLFNQYLDWHAPLSGVSKVDITRDVQRNKEIYEGYMRSRLRVAGYIFMMFAFILPGLFIHDYYAVPNKGGIHIYIGVFASILFGGIGIYLLRRSRMIQR